MIQFTRADYLAEKVTHEQYYAQFLTEPLLELVQVAFGGRIAASKDSYFNDIPLKEWDLLSTSVPWGVRASSSS